MVNRREGDISAELKHIANCGERPAQARRGEPQHALCPRCLGAIALIREESIGRGKSGRRKGAIFRKARTTVKIKLPNGEQVPAIKVASEIDKRVRRGPIPKGAWVKRQYRP